MVGYSRLIGLDDVGTLQRLRTLRSTLIDPAIGEHGGRIVNTGGDSLLIVFDSVDGAVRCAIKVQQQVPVRDGDQPPDRMIRFRIGINAGDVIPEGTDVHGGVVNVTARLQAQCPPGGICVSRAVRDHVQDRLDLVFEELGTLNLKNVNRPVEAFVLKLSSPTSASKSVEQSLLPNVHEALPLPDRPSIAVLPFTNLSSDPEQEYFSDGIADDIITELSHDRAFFVIARNSSFTYRGRSIDVKQIGRELGVRYVVEGSVRREAKRVRVGAQLIDATTGDHVWADRYDRALEHVFAVQDEIAEAVATAVRPAVGDAEQRRILRKPPGSLDAWETYQRGLWHLSKLTQTDNEQARLLFRRALDIDPAFVLAYVRLAKTYSNDWLVHGTRPIAEAVQLAEMEARKAVAIDPNDSEAQCALGQEFFSAGNLDLALDRAERALAHNRNSTASHSLKGAILTYSGQRAEGRAEMSISLRLNPRDPWSHHAGAAIAASYYFDRNYTGAIETARRALADFPAFAAPCRYLVAALGQLGRQDEATASLHKWMVTAPVVFDTMARNRLPFVRPEDHEHMLDGLRKAGWQG